MDERVGSGNFTTITELGVTLNRHFNRNLTANFGYTFLYWNDVSRAGDPIDLNVNPSKIPLGC
ncbi:MAG: BBP7 family outer membrane beta-barrel protein [Phycisphaera sp. RhM]|nr:BBP7 family outer membrane beta-barrel protein [Phycisphaera sp. RhM]